MSETDDSSPLVTYLSTHPRLLGVVFTVGLVLTSTGAATANMVSSRTGP